MTQLLRRRASAVTEPLTDDERRHARRQFVIAAVVLSGLVALGLVTDSWPTMLVVGALLVAIILHELGHYLTAKWSGMKVTEFFFGIGPRLWSVRRGETEYGVRAIPVAAYVRIIGMNNLEDVDADEEERTYRSKPFWRRLSVVSAGSVMHFLIAFVLLWSMNAFVGVAEAREDQIEIGEIVRLETGESPAQEAGLEVGDRIVAVDGQAFASGDALPAYIRERPGQELVFEVDRDGRPLTLTVVPADLSQVRVEGDTGRPVPAHRPAGFVGVRIGPPVEMVTTNPLYAVNRAGGDLVDITSLSLRAMGSLVSFEGISAYREQLTGTGAVEVTDGDARLLSPVGFVRVASAAADIGLPAVLLLLVAINVFIGLFNMVPLLPFDGGHVAVAVYERIRSRRGRQYRVDMAKLLPVTYAMVMLLAFVAITALYLDLARPLQL